MVLKEAVKTYIKAKRNLMAAAHKVAKSKSRITCNEVGMTACFYKEIGGGKLFLKTIKKYCLGNTYDIKQGHFCKNCVCYLDRLEYEKNCSELKNNWKMNNI